MPRPARRPARRLAMLAAVVVAAGVLPAFAVGSTTGAAAAAGDDRLFVPAPRFTPGGAKPRVSPERYAATGVDLAAVRRTLSAAPEAVAVTALEFAVPTPTGGTERFAVRRTTVMEPKLAAAHPEIATYSGRSLENPGTTIALDLTPMGFHASVRGAQGQRAWFVDPAYNRRGTATHLSYYGGSVPDPAAAFVEREAPELGVSRAGTGTTAAPAPGSPVTQRVYRLALTSDPTYARYFGSSNVLAEKATLINRVNQIYNDDMAIKMVLVDATDALNLDTNAKATGPNGPCGAHACFDAATSTRDSQLAYCDVPGLDRNRTVIGQLVGASNYDVGHLALGVNGGGIAFLGVVGRDFKAAGCTGLPQPRGDFFAIDYVAHEVGHQFGGNHTFNGVQQACSGGNRNGRTSVEPGSGSSVMAYAGICLQDDLQPHTDPYFSQRTIDEVTTYAASAARPVVEVQTVSLRGFDADGESITLGYQGQAPITLTRGVDYDAAGIQAAVEALTGTDVLVAGWGYDPYSSRTFPAPLTAPDRTGFQVIFATSARPGTAQSDHLDMAPLTVTSTSGGVSGWVGETARGGPAGNAGDQVIETTNSTPVVRAPGNRTIPLRTPFTLTGSGSDPDGDPLTYLWEQNDTGGRNGTGLVDNTKLEGPLFRVFGRFAAVTDSGTLQSPSPGLNQASRQPTRTFPDLAQVLSGNTNAATGRCRSVPEGAKVGHQALNCFSEFLPTPGYVGTAGSSTPALHFRLTARDGYSDGGGTGHDDVRLKISQHAGPFLVTSQADGETVRGGRDSVVRWKVNHTRGLAAQVRILLSTDGGRHWTTLVRTANDGQRTIRIPKGATRHARIKIEAVDNYFFAVNDAEFRIR